MTLAALACVAGAAIAVPHALLAPLRRASPVVGAAVWASALGLRALVATGGAVAAIVLLHPTELFAEAIAWSCAGPVPAGHHVLRSATVLPALAVAASIAVAATQLARAARAVGRVARAPLGRGPGGSLIVGGEAIVLGITGLGRPRLLVSAGALARLDDDELAAALAHEHGHLARGHRWVLLYAETCRALARFLPGTGRAARELGFQLERDADRWALHGRCDRLALASAICKSGATQPSLVGLTGTVGAPERVRELLAPAQAPGQAPVLGALAAALVALTLAAAIALPSALAAAAGDGLPPVAATCAMG